MCCLICVLDVQGLGDDCFVYWIGVILVMVGYVEFDDECVVVECIVVYWYDYDVLCDVLFDCLIEIDVVNVEMKQEVW